MRSRPDVKVLLDPFTPRPGQRLRAIVQLESHSETPVDAFDVTLVGNEARYKNTTSTGKTTTVHYHRRQIFNLGTRFPGQILPRGRWEREVYFDIPEGSPPSYRSPLSRIHYDLGVRVHIPWWPDRHAHYDLAVAALPERSIADSVTSFTSQTGEFRGEDPVIEMSIDQTTVEPGGTIRGAIAVTGLGSRRVRRVEITCCTYEKARVYSAAGPRDVARSTWKILEEAPAEGTAIPFNLRVPQDIAPAFGSVFLEVTHYLEARVVIAFGTDVVMRVPMRIAPLAPGVAGQARKVGTLVGRERQLAVWNTALERARQGLFDSIAFEPEHDRVVFSERGIEGTITEENREDLGPCLVTALHWPTLGLGLRVAQRSWTDFGSRPKGIDKGFAKDFAVRAREDAQVVQLLDAPLYAAMKSFDESALDDEGAVVLHKGGVHQLPGLERYLREVKQLVAALQERLGRIPPPAALAERLPQWKRFASDHGAHLCAGDLSLREWSVRGIPITTRFVWNDSVPTGVILATVPEDPAVVRNWSEAIARSLDGEPHTDGREAGVKVALVDDPMRLETLADRFAASVNSLLGLRTQGAYR
jgi:hypothetical protein